MNAAQPCHVELLTRIVAHRLGRAGAAQLLGSRDRPPLLSRRGAGGADPRQPGVASVELAHTPAVVDRVRALVGRERKMAPLAKLDGEKEAHLAAIACSEPPTKSKRQTLRLLADRMVELQYVDGLSYKTVRRKLKKNALKPWRG